MSVQKRKYGLKYVFYLWCRTGKIFMIVTFFIFVNMCIVLCTQVDAQCDKLAVVVGQRRPSQVLSV